MRGDSDYGSQHQHGVQEKGRSHSGAHLMKRALPTESKEIKETSVSFRGHLTLGFTDGSTLELQRGDYDLTKPPKVGEFWPPKVNDESNSEPQESQRADQATKSPVGGIAGAAAAPQSGRARNRGAKKKGKKAGSVSA